LRNTRTRGVRELGQGRTLSVGKRGDALSGLLFRFGGLTAAQYSELMERPSPEDAELGRRLREVGVEMRKRAREFVEGGRVQVKDEDGVPNAVVRGRCSCSRARSCVHRLAASLAQDAVQGEGESA
jgi:hypothetical protein